MALGFMRSRELDGWDEFKSLISQVVKGDREWGVIGDYWFRGQGDSTYKLESSLDRTHRDLKVDQRISLQDQILEAFKERAVGVSRTLRKNPEWCLGTLQHYGSPTRLLDWSTSPYIAAYFALTSPPPTGHEGSELVSVWMLNTRSSHWQSRTGLKMIKPALDGNERAFHQHGYFTLNESLSSDIESHLETYYAGEILTSPALVRIDFPRSDSSLGLRDLALMGISSESLFPEYEGLARHSYFQALDVMGLLD